jgi:hypothetical protein
MANKLIPTRIKIDGKWYRAKEEADGVLNFKNDLDYYGSTTKIEYTAIKPNPVLHAGLFHVYNMNGIKEGEFWTDPNISCSGCVTDIEIGKSNSSSSDNIGSVSPRRHFPKREESSGCLTWFFAILLFILFKNWGGRIGVLLGVIFTIISAATGSPIGNGLLAIVFLGLIGAAIGGIVNFIRKAVTQK